MKKMVWLVFAGAVAMVGTAHALVPKMICTKDGATITVKGKSGKAKETDCKTQGGTWGKEMKAMKSMMAAPPKADAAAEAAPADAPKAADATKKDEASGKSGGW